MMNREKYPRLTVGDDTNINGDNTSFVIKDARGRPVPNQDFYSGFLLPNTTVYGLMHVFNISLIVVITAHK